MSQRASRSGLEMTVRGFLVLDNNEVVHVSDTTVPIPGNLRKFAPGIAKNTIVTAVSATFPNRFVQEAFLHVVQQPIKFACVNEARNIAFQCYGRGIARFLAEAHTSGIFEDTFERVLGAIDHVRLHRQGEGCPVCKTDVTVFLAERRKTLVGRIRELRPESPRGGCSHSL